MPPRLDLEFPAGQTGTFARAQAEHTPVNGARRRNGKIREVVGHRARIDLARRHAGDEQGVQFRSEGKPAVDAIMLVVERLDAEGVAGQEQASAFVIPDREGEHAAQTAKAVLAPAGDGGQEHLGVALRPERIAAGR